MWLESSATINRKPQEMYKDIVNKLCQSSTGQASEDGYLRTLLVYSQQFVCLHSLLKTSPLQEPQEGSCSMSTAVE